MSRQYGGQIEEDEKKLAESLLGHKITKVRWFDDNPDDEWAGHETCWLQLDDGRIIEFGSWGHDATGASIDNITGSSEVEEFARR